MAPINVRPPRFQILSAYRTLDIIYVRSNTVKSLTNSTVLANVRPQSFEEFDGKLISVT